MRKYKSYIIIVLFLVLISAGGYLFSFYWKNLRGSFPAFAPPSQDIADIIDRYHTQKITDGANSMPLTLPNNFSISIFARDLGSPRVMAIGGLDDALFVSVPKQGRVVALIDADNDGDADNKYT